MDELMHRTECREAIEVEKARLEDIEDDVCETWLLDEAVGEIREAEGSAKK